MVVRNYSIVWKKRKTDVWSDVWDLGICLIRFRGLLGEFWGDMLRIVGESLACFSSSVGGLGAGVGVPAAWAKPLGAQDLKEAAVSIIEAYRSAEQAAPQRVGSLIWQHMCKDKCI